MRVIKKKLLIVFTVPFENIKKDNLSRVLLSIKENILELGQNW